MQQDNTFPIFCYSATVILAVVVFLVGPFTQDYKKSSAWLRAIFFALAIKFADLERAGFHAYFLRDAFQPSHARCSFLLQVDVRGNHFGHFD
jgi:hypothetical protein